LTEGLSADSIPLSAPDSIHQGILFFIKLLPFSLLNDLKISLNPGQPRFLDQRPLVAPSSSLMQSLR